MNQRKSDSLTLHFLPNQESILKAFSILAGCKSLWFVAIAPIKASSLKNHIQDETTDQAIRS